MKIRIAQLTVSNDIQKNVTRIENTLKNSNSDEWVLFPEGIISGYYPEKETYISQLNQNQIEEGVNKLEQVVKEKKITCLIGSALKIENEWYNCTIYISPEQKIIYKKNNLSNLDRSHFFSGNSIRVYRSENIIFGIQMCRELVFPEQWKLLKQEGAQVILHINNSIKVNDKVREHMLIARAFENQLWVCSVNNATAPQTMSSMIIDPIGNIVWQSTPQKEEIYTTDIDLTMDSNLYLKQARSDLVKVVRS